MARRIPFLAALLILATETPTGSQTLPGNTAANFLDSICSSFHIGRSSGLDGASNPPAGQPSGLVVTDTTVSLSWQAVDGAAGYRVYRDATLAGTPAGWPGAHRARIHLRQRLQPGDGPDERLHDAHPPADRAELLGPGRQRLLNRLQHDFSRASSWLRN